VISDAKPAHASHAGCGIEERATEKPMVSVPSIRELQRRRLKHSTDSAADGLLYIFFARSCRRTPSCHMNAQVGLCLLVRVSDLRARTFICTSGYQGNASARGFPTAPAPRSRIHIGQWSPSPARRCISSCRNWATAVQVRTSAWCAVFNNNAYGR